MPDTHLEYLLRLGSELGPVVTALGFWFVGRQVKLQRKALDSQRLQSRMEFYHRISTSPITEENESALKQDPGEYMFKDYYKHYLGSGEVKSRRRRRYIRAARVYELMAYMLSSAESGRKEFMGENWVRQWLSDQVRQPEFLDIHRAYGPFYPKLEKMVDDTLEQPNHPSISPRERKLIRDADIKSNRWLRNAELNPLGFPGPSALESEHLLSMSDYSTILEVSESDLDRRSG